MNRDAFGTYTQLFVSPKSQMNLPTDTDRTTESVLPDGSAHPGGAGRDIGKFEMNTPDSDSNIQPRTKGVPGDQYGNPSNDTYNTVTRRTMTGFLTLAEYMEELDFEGEEAEDDDMEESLKKRQKKQKGKKKRDSQKYYRKNRNKIKRKQKQYRKKNKAKIKRNRKRTKGKNRTRRNASVQNVVLAYLRGL